MIIYGAGLAGLLAATMLRRHKPIVCEAQPSLPNNHDALLRFRSDAVSRVTGIPFKKVTVYKGIVLNEEFLTQPELYLSNMYSRKVTGEIHGRSIMDLSPAERYIAPPNLIQQLAEGLNIEYNSRLKQLEEKDVPIISTIPMPFLMMVAEWYPQPTFNYRTVTTLTCELEDPVTDVYQTLYYPNPEDVPYRASVTGKRVIIEMMGNKEDMKEKQQEELLTSVLVDFGIALSYVPFEDFSLSEPFKLKVQRFGKIAPINDDLRREFILAMSDKHNIYSVGRYATWRNILLDDVVGDIETVEKFVNQRDSYRYKIARANQ